MAYTPLFEMWRTNVEAHPFDLLLDLGHGEDYPLATHPWFFGVRIPMTTRNAAGLPSDEEAYRLDAVENRIREAVRARDGIYVGRRTGMGARDLMFYMEERPTGLEDRMRASIGTELLFISRNDRRWEGYQQLLPGPSDWRRIEDQKLIDELTNMESELDQMHTLIHSVETSSAKGAEAIAGLMTKLELEEVEIVGKRPQIIVCGVQRTPIDHDEIFRVSWVLESKVGKARGKYAGWSAEPVFSEVEPMDDASIVDSILASLAKEG